MDERKRPTDAVRALVDEMSDATIVSHVVPYYHGYQIEGWWLDGWRDRMVAALDELDEEVQR